MKLLLLLFLIPASSIAQQTKVIRVIDGDTFVIEGGEKVRMIGINAPEVTDIFGEEAKQHLTDLISGKIVELKSDATSKDRDRYSRLLRYAFLNGVDINKKMLEDGYAFAYLKYRFNKIEDYKHAQNSGQTTLSGIWKKPKNDIAIDKPKEMTNYDIYLPHSRKAYVVGGLIGILILIGLFYLIKR